MKPKRKEPTDKSLWVVVGDYENFTAWQHKVNGICALSSIIWVADEHLPPHWEWLISFSVMGKKRLTKDDSIWALKQFNAEGFEEDNHVAGIARKFFLAVDPKYRIPCPCKNVRAGIDMEKFEVELYYDKTQQCYCMMGLSHKDIEDAGIEPQKRSWVNADYVEHLEAKIDKLEQELKIEKKSHNYHCKESQRKNDVIDNLEEENKKLKHQVDLKLFSRRQLEHDNPILKQRVKDLEQENRELIEALSSIKKFTNGIVFSGSKCGEGQCSIFIHWDNIEKIKSLTKIKSEERGEK